MIKINFRKVILAAGPKQDYKRARLRVKEASREMKACKNCGLSQVTRKWDTEEKKMAVRYF